MAKQIGGFRSMNPWVLPLQKLGLELKCPICLDLLKRPSLLPCDHIFCNSCLPEMTHFGTDCPLCKHHYLEMDTRPVSFVENIVTIYRSLDACANLFQIQSSSSGCDKFSKESLEAPENGVQKTDMEVKCILPRSLSNKDHEMDCNGGNGDEQNANTLSATSSPPPSGDIRSSENESYNQGYNSPQNYEALRLAKRTRDDRTKQQRHDSPTSGCDKLSKESLEAPENGVQKTDMEVKCILPGSLSNKDHEMDCNGGNEDELNANTVSATSSPPPPGDIRSSENESYDQGYNSPQNYEALRLAKRTPDDRKKQERHDSPTSGTCVNFRDSKRHKKLNMPTNSKTKILDICNPKSDHVSVKTCEAQTQALLPDSSIVKTTCGFCQSSMISKETGPMLHVVNGKLVDGDEAYLPNAMHVHMICTEWAPQVYFIDEQTVKNLKAEVVRGAKLKCIGCDVEGAALGCYHKSCPRSYHVMCAKEIAGCRWDHENHLLLCPSHTCVKFPNEKKSKSKSKNQVVHTQTPSQHTEVPDIIAPQQSNFWLESRNRAKEWVFCGSALCSEDKDLLVEFGMMIGVAVSKYWSADVTHVIAATDENGAYARTMKVLMAILNGRWVLTVDWVKAGLNSMRSVNEQPYEVSLDNYGCHNGPKTGRLSVLDNAPKLFNGFSFYFSGDFPCAYKEDLQILVTEAGGNIIDNKEEIVKKRHEYSEAPSKSLVVYNNLDPPQGVKLGEEVTSLWQRLKQAEDLAVQNGFQVIGHTWLLESIASYKVQPFVS